MTHKQPAYLIQGKNIILVIDGKSHTISKDTHISYGKIVDALKAQAWDELRDLVEPKKAIVNFGAGNVSIEGNEVFWKGNKFHNSLASRMIEMYMDGFPIDPMVRFMENLMDNPSRRSVEQMYTFLEKNKLPITEDGYFLAYKRVRNDYKDIHSGTNDNSIGQIVEMDRNLVDDNPDSYCSVGLHFCSESYLGHFGSIFQPVMILKISPADVVSVPKDYDGAKGRCCRYEVVGQVNGDPKEAFTSVVNSDYTKEAPPVVESLNSSTAWPFPVGDKPDGTRVTNTTGSYRVVRVFGNDVEGSGLQLQEARELVAKNVRQKKAQLKILDHNGNMVV